jgi:hypothetical protein
MRRPNLSTDLTDLLFAVRLISGVPEHVLPQIVAITFKVGDRFVEAKPKVGGD